MILASAQTKPLRKNIPANLSDHTRLVKIAAINDANLIIFPEMSITGYERAFANELAFTENDPRLAELKQLANKHDLFIVAGAPIRIESNLYIGSFILGPNDYQSIYLKQFLHEGEELFFDSSLEHNPMLEIGSERASFAICADIDHHLHAANAGAKESSLYLASIFFSPNGIGEGHRLLSSYAQEFEMNVLMSNYGGESWDMESGGRSGFWNQKGELIMEMGEDDSGLLIVEKRGDSWQGKLLVDS